MMWLECAPSPNRYEVKTFFEFSPYTFFFRIQACQVHPSTQSSPKNIFPQWINFVHTDAPLHKTVIICLKLIARILINICVLRLVQILSPMETRTFLYNWKICNLGTSRKYGMKSMRRMQKKNRVKSSDRSILHHIRVLLWCWSP